MNVIYNNGKPVIMSDGRFITDYSPSKELTINMQKKYGIRDTNKFRSFMTKNADHIIRDNMMSNLGDYNVKSNICCDGWRQFNSKF